MEPMVTLSHELRRLRTERQMSQERLAARADISQAVLSRYESGQRRPSFAALAKLAPVLGVRGFDFGSGRLLGPLDRPAGPIGAAQREPDPPFSAEELRRLAPLIADAIRRIEAGESLPPMPAFAQVAKHLNLPRWEALLHGGPTSSTLTQEAV